MPNETKTEINKNYKIMEDCKKLIQKEINGKCCGYYKIVHNLEALDLSTLDNDILYKHLADCGFNFKLFIGCTHDLKPIKKEDNITDINYLPLNDEIDDIIFSTGIYLSIIYIDGLINEFKEAYEENKILSFDFKE